MSKMTLYIKKFELDYFIENQNEARTREATITTFAKNKDYVECYFEVKTAEDLARELREFKETI